MSDILNLRGESGDMQGRCARLSRFFTAAKLSSVAAIYPPQPHTFDSTTLLSDFIIYLRVNDVLIRYYTVCIWPVMTTNANLHRWLNSHIWIKRRDFPRHESDADLAPYSLLQITAWEEKEMDKPMEIDEIRVDPSPFQLVERTSLHKVGGQRRR